MIPTAKPKKIAVIQSIKFLDINTREISTATKALMKKHLLYYRDTSEAMSEHLFYMEDAEAILLDKKVSVRPQVMEEINAVQSLCKKKRAAYVRLVIE